MTEIIVKEELIGELADEKPFPIIMPNICVERTRWDSGVFPVKTVARAAHARR